LPKAAHEHGASQTTFAQVYAQIVESAGIAVGLYDPAGRVLQFNQLACEQLGVSRDHAVGKSVEEIFPASDAERFASRIREVFESGCTRDYEDQVDLGAGPRWHLSIYSRMVDPDGVPTGVLIFSHDITERKRVERALEEMEQRYASLFQRSLDCVYLHDTTGRFLDANQAALDLLGYTRGEVANLCFTDLLDEEGMTIAAAYLQELVTLGFQKELACYRLRRKDGTFVDIETRAVLLHREGTPHAVLGIARDITERKRMQRERAALEEQLRHAQKMDSLGKMAGGIAHDFNNLLTTVGGNVDLIRMDLDPADPSAELLSEVARATERAADLTRQLLAFSRKQVINPQPCDLNDIVRGQAKMLARLIGERIELVLDLEDPLHAVCVDAPQVEQVLVNLVLNARDAMAGGGQILVSTRNLLTDPALKDRSESCVALVVRDTGTGIAPDLLERIFDPFFTTKEVGKGTGLGLAVSYGIVQQHGGEIFVESHVDQGSTFTVWLPRTEHFSIRQSRRIRASSLPPGSQSVLVVEDEPAVRRLAARILRRAGYQVLEAESGEAALALLQDRDQPVHLLITDLVMPGMDGRELARRVADLAPNIKVLYTSGYANDVLEGHGLDGDPNAFIGKPYRPSALALRVQRILADRSRGGPVTGP